MIYWFRTDLRVGDNLALAAASASAARLLPVYCHDPAADTSTRWGFTRRSAHRRTFLDAALTDLDAALRARGSRLLQVRGAAADVLPALARALGTDRVACEAIAAPEEVDELASLRAAGLQVRAVNELHKNVDGACAHCAVPYPCETKRLMREARESV